MLVTGGTGFIGSHLVPLLHEAGAEVTVVAPDPGWREPLRSLISAGAVRLLPERTWWTPPTAGRIAREVPEVDHLVHLGYRLPQGTAAERARDESTFNVAGTLGLVAALSQRVGHVCLASSVKVYGRAARPLRESACALPADPYGAAKLAVEQQLRVLAEAGGPATTAVRLTTLYGPGEVVPRAIPSFIRAGLSGQRPTVRGPGSEMGDYMHVRDAGRLLVQSLVRPPDQHRLVNAGTGEGHTTRDLAERVLRLVRDRDDDGDGVAVAEAPEHADGEPGADSVCDTTRAEAELGFRAAVSLDEGLAEEIGWFAQRPRLWRDHKTAHRREAS